MDYDKFVEGASIYRKHVLLYSEPQIEGQPSVGSVSAYPFIALGGEAGELLNAIKKIHRDEAGVITSEAKRNLLLELGDILWYLTACAHELGYTLDHVMDANVAKLEARKTKVG